MLSRRAKAGASQNTGEEQISLTLTTVITLYGANFRMFRGRFGDGEKIYKYFHHVQHYIIIME